MSIATGISAVKTGFELVKGLVDILKRPDVDAHDVLARLVELQGLMLAAREALSGAQDEIERLKKQIADHEHLDQLQKAFEHVPDGGFIILKSDREQNRFIPYCPVCWGNGQKAVPLTPGGIGVFRCVIHNATYITEVYREAQRKGIQTNSSALNKRFNR
jgi:hypothetical protein